MPHFIYQPVYGQVGGMVQFGSGQSAAITDVNGNPLTVTLTNGGTSTTVTPDSTGRIEFDTGTSGPGVVQVTINGFTQQVTSGAWAAGLPAQLTSIVSGSPSDAAVNALVTTGGTATRGSLDTLYALPASPAAFNLPMRNSANTGLVWTTSQAMVARALGWTIVTDPAYGAKIDSTTDDTTAWTNAINATPSGGTVWMPATPGKFSNITAALPLVSGLNYRGAGRTVCEIRATAGNVFAPSAAMHDITIEGLTLSANAAHVIDLGTGSGGLYQSTIRNCSLVARGNGVSILNGNGSITWQEVYVENCVLTRQPGATVPGVNLIASTGGLNASVWEKLVVYSNNATGTPFFHVEASGAGTYVYDNAFRNITGEQNVGGLIHLFSGVCCAIEQVVDWDVTGSYTASLVLISKTTGGFPNRIRVSSMGNRGGTINGTTVFQLEVASSANNVTYDRVGDALGNRYIKNASASTSIVSVGDGWGASGALRTTTASDNLYDTKDGTVVFNGASLTATLPDPTTVPLGRKFTAKNINSSSLTVVSAGTSKTIDGAASKTLAQWAWVTVQSDTTQWLIVG